MGIMARRRQAYDLALKAKAEKLAQNAAKLEPQAEEVRILPVEEAQEAPEAPVEEKPTKKQGSKRRG